MKNQVIVLVGFLALFHPAIGQEAKVASSKETHLDVVSIRPSADNREMVRLLPDEYLADGPLFATIMTAYFPLHPVYWRSDGLVGAPPWVFKDNYDVTAKIDSETAEQWKGLSDAARLEKMKLMLREMLADRCKLAIHSVDAETRGFALIATKHGRKFTQALPNAAPPPDSFPLIDGGWRVHHPSELKPARITLVGVSMAQVAEFVMAGGDRPVMDMTGLTGRYNIEILEREDELGSSSDPDPAGRLDLKAIGLDLKSAMVPTTTLVVDHIERPAQN